MELVNTTRADAVVDLTTEDGSETRKAARVTFKATFEVDSRGPLKLVGDDPVPVLRNDEQTSCGVLPRDVASLPREGVEVIVNGAAYAPGGAPISEMVVSITVGSLVWHAHIVGDRHWLGEGRDARPSDAVPVPRIPSTYERAFGGSAEVWLDEHTPVPIRHPANPSGRGFDPEPVARALAEQLGATPSFPRFDYVRALPNIEDPRERIRGPADSPRPYCWSARPLDAAGAALVPTRIDVPSQESGGPAPEAAWLSEVRAASAIRCHPELLVREPIEGARIALHGLTPDGVFGFRFPSDHPILDYHIDGRTGERVFTLKRIVLLPEERRFTATYETKFRFDAKTDGERSLRIRLVDA